MPTPVQHSLGADMVWWRTADGMRTVASLFRGGDYAFAQSVHLMACLHDAHGQELARWRVALSQEQQVIFDSAAPGEWSPFTGIDGILALHLCTDQPPSPEALAHERLYPSLDWLSPDGRLSTLHSDQIVSRHVTKLQRFTEMVVVETDDEHNALVILNGDQPQAAGALALTVVNHRGEQRTARHAAPMAPFTVTQVALAPLFPGLVAFGEGRPLLVEGAFDSNGLFTRPYVVTTGSRQGVYHGGDVYHFKPVHPAQNALIQGEVNPMAVMLDGHTRTWINLLHSHDGHDDDVPVDIRLYDDGGHCVLDQTHACVATRGKLTRIDLATLVPPGTERFSGHVALSFSVSLDQYVPARLQALFEYEHRGSVAHIMGWSDEWNSRLVLARRRKKPPHVHRSWYRVWHDGEFQTELVITNAGHRDYSETAKVRLTLHGAQGASVSTEVEIAPYATLRKTVAELFGNDPALLGGSSVGVLRIDSTSDLAAVSITRNQQGTALAMEHFMSLYTRGEDTMTRPAGT